MVVCDIHIKGLSTYVIVCVVPVFDHFFSS